MGEGLEIVIPIEEAAERAGMHVVHMRRLASEGVLPAFKNGNRWFISSKELSAFLKSTYPRGRQRRKHTKKFKGLVAPVTRSELDEVLDMFN